MSSTPGLVASFERLSFVDGPGSRFVLFLQGCNFDCTACHNPSTIALAPPPGVAEEMTVGRMADIIRETAPFLSGVTVTGGEPTLQLDFLIDLFEEIKSDPEMGHLTTLVDTNGTLPPAHWERLAPVMDGAMVDLKACAPGLHLELTGKGNTAVKESIRWLYSRGRLTEVRLLVVEGVTDDETELDSWAGFISSVGRDIPVRLMGFRRLGVREPALAWAETTDAALHRVKRRLNDLGLESVITGLSVPEPV